jgi:hypothetical protein
MDETAIEFPKNITNQPTFSISATRRIGIKVLSGNSNTLLILFLPISLDHFVPHQSSWSSASGEELELREGLLGQDVEAVHEDPAFVEAIPHLLDDGGYHWAVGQLGNVSVSCRNGVGTPRIPQSRRLQ